MEIFKRWIVFPQTIALKSTAITIIRQTQAAFFFFNKLSILSPFLNSQNTASWLEGSEIADHCDKSVVYLIAATKNASICVPFS